MRTWSKTAIALAVVGLHAGGAFAQGASLTLAEVLARAREQAPAIVAARLAVAEARGRLLGASVRYQENLAIDGGIGNRNGPVDRFTDWEIGASQPLGASGRRDARIAVANAAIAQSAANVDAVTRSVLRDAAAAYFRALHASERIRLLTRAEDLAASVHAIADRRFRAGDIAVLDVNIARAALGRVRSDREGAEAERALALGELRQLLRLPDVDVQGTLTMPADRDLATALLSAAQRPELRVLQAALDEANAEAGLGATYGRPEWDAGLRYSQEEGDKILLGSMSITLPVFQKGQEISAVATARSARLREELGAAQQRVQLEVRAAFDAYRRRVAAVHVLEAEAISGLDENEQLTTRSFEVGQLGLPDLLLLRREILETRAQYLDALLEAVLSQVDLDASAAILR